MTDSMGGVDPSAQLGLLLEEIHHSYQLMPKKCLCIGASILGFLQADVFYMSSRGPVYAVLYCVYI
jgi:hypothetical protein